MRKIEWEDLDIKTWVFHWRIVTQNHGCAWRMSNSSVPMQAPSVHALLMGAVRIRHSIREIATQPVILWILLGGKPKWLPLNFGFNDVMRTAPIWFLMREGAWYQTLTPLRDKVQFFYFIFFLIFLPRKTSKTGRNVRKPNFKVWCVGTFTKYSKLAFWRMCCQRTSCLKSRRTCQPKLKVAQN